MTGKGYLTGQESRDDLLDLRRQRIKERRIRMAGIELHPKKAYVLTDNVISLCRSGKEAVQNLYLPPEYPKIA